MKRLLLVLISCASISFGLYLFAPIYNIRVSRGGTVVTKDGQPYVGNANQPGIHVNIGRSGSPQQQQQQQQQQPTVEELKAIEFTGETNKLIPPSQLLGEEAEKPLQKLQLKKPDEDLERELEAIEFTGGSNKLVPPTKPYGGEAEEPLQKKILKQLGDDLEQISGQDTAISDMKKAVDDIGIMQPPLPKPTTEPQPKKPLPYVNVNDARTAFPRVRHLLWRSDPKSGVYLGYQVTDFSFQDILGEIKNPQPKNIKDAPQPMPYPKAYDAKTLNSYKTFFIDRMYEIANYLQRTFAANNPNLYRDAINLLKTVGFAFLDRIAETYAQQNKVGMGKQSQQQQQKK